MTPDLSEDRLLGGRVVLRQPREGFRAAIDSVLLAAAVPARPGDRVFEPGIGSGAAALCLARRVPGCAVLGIDRQPALAALAMDNARRNGLDAAIEARPGDVGDGCPDSLRHAFAHVMMNPPHLAAGRASPPPAPAAAAARVESQADLASWIRLAFDALKPKGSLTLIHRADRLDEILAALRGRAGGVVVFPLWPRREGAPAKRVVVLARTAIAAPMRLAPGLVLHEADGSYTAAADDALRGSALRLETLPSRGARWQNRNRGLC